MSDIFGALLDQFIGKSEVDIWLNGEDVQTPNIPGDASRYMCDPANDNASRDYYPDRYRGTDDFGGVHWNSGIANLGEFM
jgi:bacillolysin